MKIVLALLAAGIVAAVPASALTTPARIAFNAGLTTSHPDVVTVSPDEQDLLNLTPGTADFFTADMNPSWSPDGTRIAFDSHRDSNVSTEIYVANADGSGQQRLTHDSGQGDQIFNSQPLWSPRGDLIAFLKLRGGQSYDLWVMRPDGSGQRRLTGDGGVKQSISWSPDGTQLLYTRGEAQFTRIYTVSVDGSPPIALSPEDATDYSPAWSPDGAQIALATPALTVMNADGTNRHRIVDLSASTPAWSPDGTRIAFTGIRSFSQYSSPRFGTPSRPDVLVVDANGANLRRLTGPFDDGELAGPQAFQPTWWPDGSRLFYLSQRNLTPYTTFVMNADGTCEKRFLPGNGIPDLQQPVWQPGAGPMPPITRCAELRLSASIAKTTVALDESAVWTFTIDNDGNLPATGVRLEVGIGTTTGTNLTYRSQECTGNGSSVACTVDSIPPGGSSSLVVEGRRSKSGPIRLEAQVFGNEFDTDPTNNSTATGADVLPCTTVGTWGSDYLVGTPGPDRICGLPGADTIYGGKGNDFIDAGNGDDRIYPGPGRDTVIAKGGNDIVEARDGERDWIDCGGQHDIAVVDRVDVTRHCEVVARG